MQTRSRSKSVRSVKSTKTGIELNYLAPFIAAIIIAIVTIMLICSLSHAVKPVVIEPQIQEVQVVPTQNQLNKAYTEGFQAGQNYER